MPDPDPLVNFWFTKLPAKMVLKAERARLKNGHNKRTALTRMIESYIKPDSKEKSND